MKQILLILTSCITFCATAQSTFITHGKIEFEKKVNVQKEMESNSFYDIIRDKIPKYQTTYYELSFKDGKTFYEKGRDPEEKNPYFGTDRNADDVIFTDINQGTFVKKQAVFEETFLLTDSIRSIKWKITDETRDIAGFECRKAVGIILDSVFIVAFYTDQITVSGGPMSYANLPGMILGIAIPRFNTTLFATKLELIDPKPEKLTAPTGNRMKKTDYKTLTQTLQKVYTDFYGTSSSKYLLPALL